MKLVIELDPELPSYSMSIDIGNKEYDLDIEWNVRGGFWTVAISDSEGLITKSVAQTEYPLFLTCKDERLPSGMFWVVDMTEKNQEITRNNFGTEILLMYTDEN